VKLAVLGITEGATDPITQWHKAGEAFLMESLSSVNFVRPGAFMSNTLESAWSIRQNNTVYAPFGDLAVASVDPIDIAAAAFELLTTPRPDGAAVAVTGPTALTPRQQVSTLADVLGRAIRSWKSIRSRPGNKWSTMACPPNSPTL
jgi:(4-alkanoyl-5-oxo-2,5-dihydrofuran-3-yl)methyl phosphate reductase